MNNHKNKILALIFFLTCTISFPNYAWENREYGHFSEGESLRSVLLNFGAAIGVSLNISDKVQGEFSGILKNAPAKQFLENISKRYNLIWFYDGVVLHIYKNDEIRTELVRLKYKTPALIKRSLKTLQLWDPRYPWRIAEGGKLLNLSGPPKYVDKMVEIITALDIEDEFVEGSEFVTRSFKLYYSRAADYVVTARDKETIIPGVATMLGNLMAKVQLPEDDDKKEKDRASRIFGSSSPTHFIQADTRRNAIIVYDRLKKMELYAYLIAEMDQPTDQIQIEVSIFDIEERKLKDIGINWQYSNDSAQQTFGFGDVVGNLADEDTSINLGESNELSYFLGNGSTVSTVLEEGGEYFITRVRALADKGYAKVLSQPSILTQDNLEAVLDNSRTFFIRLEGQEAVSLQRVTVGSLLKVTPQIVDDFIGTRQVQLNLNIEDGVITNETVDDLPIINETKISTNAQIDEGSSLLIGGYFFNVRNESEVKTPFLGSIPLLGHLFKRTVTENSKTARLFMLTPKIVSTSINLESSEFEKSMLNQYYEETEEKFDFFKAIEILD